MRKIIFKARRLDNGEWVFGDLNHFSDSRAAVADSEQDWFLVDPETVCQYTGLNDKNGNRIFEGDRVLHNYMGSDLRGIVLFGEYADQRHRLDQGFYVRWQDTVCSLRSDLGFWTTHRKIEVIGNIHDSKAVKMDAQTDSV